MGRVSNKEHGGTRRRAVGLSSNTLNHKLTDQRERERKDVDKIVAAVL